MEQDGVVVDGEGAAAPVVNAAAAAALAAVEDANVTERGAGPERIGAALDVERDTAAPAAVVTGTEPADAAGGTEVGTGALPTGALTTAEATALMETLRAAHPDAVAELITGATVAEIVGSVAGAKAAHARIVAATGAAAPVAAGGGGRAATGPDLLALSPQAKIAYGLTQRQ